MLLRILARSSRATSSGTLRRLRSNRFSVWRRTAAEIAARYPAVSPDELARASAIVAPQIQELAAESANLGANVPAGGEALRGFVASGFASIPVLVSIVCGLISVLAVPGGLVTRALRHAVVRRDGREIGRARSAIRFLVAWSPALAWIACVGVPMFGEPRVSPDVAFVVGSLAFLLMAAGVAWTIASSRARTARPHRRHVGCAKVGNGQGVDNADISVCARQS